MPTKSGVARVQDVKQGVTLFHVFSITTAEGKRRVGGVERYTVTGRELQSGTPSLNLNDWRLYFKYGSSWTWNGDQFIYDDRFASDMGVQPKGRLWLRDTGTKCFLSYRRAESYRKRLLMHPQTDAETRDAIRFDDLLDRVHRRRA